MILKFFLNSNVNSSFVIITYYYYYSVKRICIVLAKRNKTYYHLVNISESNPYIFIIAISIQIYHFCNRIFTNIFNLLFISLLTVSFHFIFSITNSSIYIIYFLYKYEYIFSLFIRIRKKSNTCHFNYCLHLIFIHFSCAIR